MATHPIWNIGLLNRACPAIMSDVRQAKKVYIYIIYVTFKSGNQLKPGIGG